MNTGFESLEQNTIICVKESDTLIANHTAFAVSEIVLAMQNQMGRNEKWFEGIDCEILSPIKGLHKGKVRIALEFCSDDFKLIESAEDNQPIPSLSEELLNEVWQLLLNSID
jgi:hypothetical protein